MAGRPKQLSEHEKNTTIRVTPELLFRLDESRRRERDIPSRSEMMRRLVVFALDQRDIPVPTAEQLQEFEEDD